MRRWTSWLCIAGLAANPFAAWAQPQQPSAEERYDELIRAIDSEAERPRNERTALLGKIYDELFPRRSFDRLETISDEALDLTFKAAVNAVRLVGRPGYVRQAELAFDELQARQLALPSHFSYMQGVYVQMRMLDEAGRFHAQHPSMGLAPIPAVRVPAPLPSGAPTAMTVSPDGRALVRHPVDLSGPARIVVVAHPRCHFSRNAMLAIEADPVLSQVFRESAMWLMPPDFRLEVDAVHRWNEAHPLTRLMLAYKVDEWPQLDYWGTPTFYFFQEGELEAKVTGWPKGGRREELLAALREVGLLPAGHRPATSQGPSLRGTAMFSSDT